MRIINALLIIVPALQSRLWPMDGQRLDLLQINAVTLLRPAGRFDQNALFVHVSKIFLNFLLLVNIGLSANLHKSLLPQDARAAFEIEPLTNLVKDVGWFDPGCVGLRVLSTMYASCTQALVPLGSNVRLV